MIRKLLVALILVLLYQAAAIALLFTSDYRNVVSYYTHPPTKGGIELGTTRTPTITLILVEKRI